MCVCVCVFARARARVVKHYLAYIGKSKGVRKLRLKRKRTEFPVCNTLRRSKRAVILLVIAKVAKAATSKKRECWQQDIIYCGKKKYLKNNDIVLKSNCVVCCCIQECWSGWARQVLLTDAVLFLLFEGALKCSFALTCTAVEK